MPNKDNGQMDFSQSLPEITQFVSQVKSLTESLRTFQNVLQNTAVSQESFTKQTKENTNTIRNLKTGSENATKSIKQLGDQSKRTQESMTSFSNSGKSAIGALQKLHSSINNVKFGIEGLILSLGGKKLWEFLIGSNQEIETLQQSLEVTLQSTERAAETIRMMRSYAALTPFDELETFKSGEMLVSNRMEVERWMKIAGDLASAKRTTGAQIEDVVRILTRVNAGDFGKAMIRLRQLGISLQDLKAKGLEFTKSNTFLGTSDEMLHAIERIVEERYSGLTLALGQTVDGLISTIGDYFLQYGIEMGDESFNQLKDFLIEFKDQLDDFRNSIDFKEVVQDFNFLKAEIIDGLSPWITGLKLIFGMILKNLPLIGTMIKTYLHFQLFNNLYQVLQKTLGFVINMTNNWALVSKATVAQNALLAEQNDKTAKQTLELGTQLSILAKINAMRKLGNQYASEQLAAEASATSIMQAGALKGTTGKMASTFAGAGTDTALLAGTAAAGKAGAETAAAGGGALASIAAALPVILGVVGAFIALGVIVKGIVTVLTPNEYDLKRTTNDYERMIGDQSEEIETLEALNSQRQYGSELIKYHSEMVDQNSKTVEDLTIDLKSQTQAYKEGKTTEEAVIKTRNDLKQAEDNLRRSRNELSSATEELIRRQEQMMEISPELSSQLLDENGRLNSNTESFDANTEAIKRNIDARKVQLSDTFYQQMDVAETERKRALNQIETIQTAIDVVRGNQNDALGSNPFAQFLASGFSSVRGWFVNDDEQKYMSKAFDVLKLDDEGQELAISDMYHDMYELQKTIQNLDETLEESEEMIRQGYFRKDESGEPILDEYGRYILDVSEFNQNRDRLEAQRTQDIREGDIDASDLEERLQSTKSDITNIQTKYQVELNQLLLSGVSKDSVEYQNTEKQMYQEIADFWLERNEDVKALREKFDASVQQVLDQTPQELRQMIVDGINVDQMIEAVETIREFGLFAIDEEMKKYSTELQKIADSNITNLDVYTADFENYITRMNVQSLYDDAERNILKERTDALVNKLGKSSTSKSLLTAFNDEWDTKKQIMSSEKDVILSNDELVGREPGSAIYDLHLREENLKIRDFILTQINALRNLMPSLDTKEKLKAQLQLLKLQKESNDLLLAIRENTSKVGEFNRPSAIKSLTWYDYKTQGQEGGGVEIGNAEFLMNVEGPLTAEDIEQTMNEFAKFAQKKYSKGIKTVQNSGIKNPKITGIS